MRYNNQLSACRQKGIWEQIEQAERKRIIQEGIRKLPPRDRLFMILHFEMGLSVKEVAQAMQLSIDNAHTVKHRAIQKLKFCVETVGY